MNEPTWTCSFLVAEPNLERMRVLAVAVMAAGGTFSGEHTRGGVWKVEVEAPPSLRETVGTYAAGETVLDATSSG